MIIDVSGNPKHSRPWLSLAWQKVAFVSDPLSEGGHGEFFCHILLQEILFIHFLVLPLPAPTITITSENLKVFIIQSQVNSEFGLSTGNRGALVNGQYRMASKAFSLVQTSRDNPPSHWPPTSLWMPHCLTCHKMGDVDNIFAYNRFPQVCLCQADPVVRVL